MLVSNFRPLAGRTAAAVLSIASVLVSPCVYVFAALITLANAPHAALGLTITVDDGAPRPFIREVRQFALDDEGRVTLARQFGDPDNGIINTEGVWQSRGTRLELVAFGGGAAPGFEQDGGRLGSSVFAKIGNSGHYFFTAAVWQDSPSILLDYGLWSNRGGELELALSRNTPAPGASGGSFFYFQNYETNDHGQLIINDEVNGASGGVGGQGIWRETSDGRVTPIARFGQPAPSIDGAAPLGDTFGAKVDIDDAGRAVFFSRSLFSSEESPRRLLRETAGGQLQLLAQDGASAAGLPNDVTLKEVRLNETDGDGNVAFTASLAGNVTTGVNDSGIWRHRLGTGVELIARTGDVAPGSSGAVVFSELENPTINQSGAIVFASRLVAVASESEQPEATSGAPAIWSDAAGNGLEIVVQAGDDAPGTPAGTRFGSFSSRGESAAIRTSPQLNDSGQIAFAANVSGPTVTGDNREGVWAQDAGGGLTLIARTGDLVDIGADPLLPELRTIESIEWIDLNNFGQVAFVAGLDDGSEAVFVSDAVVDYGPQGDYNSDELVDTMDLLVWQQSFGNTTTSVRGADGNRDFLVSAADYTLWRDAVSDPSDSASQAVAVPEPGVLGLLLAGFPLVCQRRSRAS